LSVLSPGRRQGQRAEVHRFAGRQSRVGQLRLLRASGPPGVARSSEVGSLARAATVHCAFFGLAFSRSRAVARQSSASTPGVRRSVSPAAFGSGVFAEFPCRRWPVPWTSCVQRGVLPLRGSLSSGRRFVVPAGVHARSVVFSAPRVRHSGSVSRRLLAPGLSYAQAFAPWVALVFARRFPARRRATVRAARDDGLSVRRVFVPGAASCVVPALARVGFGRHFSPRHAYWSLRQRRRTRRLVPRPARGALSLAPPGLFLDGRSAPRLRRRLCAPGSRVSRRRI
jgi:hypothetical protein